MEGAPPQASGRGGRFQILKVGFRLAGFEAKPVRFHGTRRDGPVLDEDLRADTDLEASLSRRSRAWTQTA
jgi:hypothetical protein